MANPIHVSEESSPNEKDIGPLGVADALGINRYPESVETAFTDATFLGRQWWSLAARGLAAFVLGLVALIAPLVAILGLVVLFGAYALIDGTFSLIMAVRARPHRPRRGWLVLEGVAGLGAGLVAFGWPGVTALVLVMLVAGWAIITGIAKIATAMHLRKHVTGEWMLVLSGLLSIGMGAVLLVFPLAGEVAVTWWLGAYGLIFGVLAIALSFRLRGLQRADHLDAQCTELLSKPHAN